MIRGLGEWKHLVLLATLVVAAVLEPVSVDWSENARIAGTFSIVALNVVVLLAVFEKRWERTLALVLLISVFAAGIAHEFVKGPLRIGGILFHCLAAVFFAFAVAVILKRIFQ